MTQAVLISKLRILISQIGLLGPMVWYRIELFQKCQGEPDC